MSRSSTATVRRRPVAHVASAAGELSVQGETVVVSSARRIEIVDLTDRVSAIVHP